MELSDGAPHLMEVQSNLKAACIKHAVIFENKDGYGLAANMVRAAVGCRDVHSGASNIIHKYL